MTVTLFRKVAIAEGISFLILLLVAMPLKYFFHLPEAVKIFGWAHGVLFVVYLWLAFRVMEKNKKNFGWLLKAFVAAILPCGTFVFDKELKNEQASV
jgi:integral membrane protein